MFSALCSQLKDVESALDIHVLMGEAATLDILQGCGISDELNVSLSSGLPQNTIKLGGWVWSGYGLFSPSNGGSLCEVDAGGNTDCT